MSDQINKILEQTLTKLPNELVELISSRKFIEDLSTVTKGHPLQEYQQVAVENEVIYVMLGLENADKLVTNIKHHAKISRDRADKIFKIIADNILVPNKQILEKAFSKEDKTSKTNDNVLSADEIKNKPNDSSEAQNKKPHHEYAVDPYHEPIE